MWATVLIYRRPSFGIFYAFFLVTYINLFPPYYRHND